MQLIKVAAPYFSAKQKEKVFTGWKYASTIKAKMFKNAYPGLKATDEEIETCTYRLSNYEYNKYDPSKMQSWKGPRLLKALKARILLYRDNPVWQHVNPKKAALFLKKFPGLKATPEELEAAAAYVGRGGRDFGLLTKLNKLSEWKNERNLRDMANYIQARRSTIRRVKHIN